MALGAFIAGAFTGTLNAAALGITEDGYKLSWEPKSELIEKSDVYGDKILDTIYRGTNWFIQTEFMETNAAVANAGFQWATMGTEGVIGRLASDVAQALVLTATTGTPAAATPATLTASKAILAPGSNPESTYTSRLRTLPVKFILLPYSSSGIKHYTTT